MKKQGYLSLALMILAGMLTVSAQAQPRNRQEIRVDLPFAFNVGNTLLPAGEYRVMIVNPSSDHSVLQVRSLDGKSTMMVRTTDIVGWAPAEAKLSFRRYGERYFLAQVWMAAESTGLATPSSRAEKILQRQLGKSNRNADIVAVNAY